MGIKRPTMDLETVKKRMANRILYESDIRALVEEVERYRDIINRMADYRCCHTECSLFYGRLIAEAIAGEGQRTQVTLGEE